MTGIKKIRTTETPKLLNLSLALMSALALSACDNDKLGIDDIFDDIVNPDLDGDGFSANEGDCDDENAAVNPDALEVCDGLDNDCNTKIDDGMLSWEWEGSEAKWRVGEGVATLVIEQDSRGWDGMDMMADGLVDERRIVQFDGSGKILTDEIDRNLDGEIDLKKQYTYTGGGLLRDIETDINADGSIEKKESFNYLGDVLLDKTIDLEADGQIDSIERWNRNEEGQLTSITLDDNADGEIDSGTWFHYDESGLLISEVTRENGEQTGSKLYAYSDTGSLLYIDIDSEDDDDNSIDNRRFESEDIENQLKVIEIDKDLDGEIDEIHTEHYDQEGRLRKIDKDYDLDQAPDHMFSLIYGDHGLVVMGSEDLLNGDEEGFEVSHIRSNKWESIRTISTGMFEAMIQRNLSFECESTPEEE